jgi:hypothetical protein
MLAEEEFDGTNVIVKRLGECQGFSHQSGTSLAEGAVESLLLVSILLLLAIQR